MDPPGQILASQEEGGPKYMWAPPPPGKPGGAQVYLGPASKKGGGGRAPWAPVVPTPLR